MRAQEERSAGRGRIGAAATVLAGATRPSAGTLQAAPAGAQAQAQARARADTEAHVADHQIKVAMAAYFIAEKRGFGPGHELDDWLAAETEIAQTEQEKIAQPVASGETRCVS